VTPEVLKGAEARAIAARLAHDRLEDGATAAKLSLRTFQRILAKEHVRAALAAEATRRLRSVTVSLARRAERAADCLGQMADGTLPPQGARVRACIGVLEFALRAVETEDLARRIEELERAGEATVRPRDWRPS
jgi:hypothetical protein